MFPSELRISQLWAALDPQICPDNSDLIAYVSGGDIWVTHTLSGHGERLTYAHDGRRTLSEDPLMAGVPSYVMQEEFSRYQGYWWQPNSTSKIVLLIFPILFVYFSLPRPQMASSESSTKRWMKATFAYSLSHRHNPLAANTKNIAFHVPAHQMLNPN